MTERYIHGEGVDEPAVWMHGSGASDIRAFLHDYHGSVIGWADASGNLVDLYRYGPYGEPKNAANQTSFTGARFRYTGQTVIPEAGLYYYKARVYDPMFGRFLQTDPIGSKDDLDLYDYVGDDPINRNDPTGLFKNCKEYQKAGGGGCTDIKETHEDPKTHKDVTTVTGMSITSLPSKAIFDQHFRSGDGIDFTIPVSAVLKSKDVDWKKLAKDGYQLKKFSNIEGQVIYDVRARVLGSVTLERTQDGGATIATDKYDFEQHKTRNPYEAARNIGTALFDPCFGRSDCTGKPFNFHFEGEIKEK